LQKDWQANPDKWEATKVQSINFNHLVAAQ
jgi:hypothetical protein